MKKFAWALVATSFAVVPFAPVFAQEAEEALSAQAAEEGKDQEPVERVPDVRKADQADRYINTMKEVLRTVLKYLEEAREERDVVKLNCINEKLTAVKGLLRISETSDVALREALARRDPDSAAHEFEKIAIAARKVEQLRAESEACVGELAVYSGETQVEVEINGEPPTPADPVASAPPVVVPPVRPPAASPISE